MVASSLGPGKYLMQHSNVSRCHCLKHSEGISMAVSASQRPQLTLGLSSGRLAPAKLLISVAASASSRLHLSRKVLNTSVTLSPPAFLLFLLGCEQALLVLAVTTNESSGPSSSASSSRAVLVASEISA